MRRCRSMKRLVATALVTIALLAACGDDDEAPAKGLPPSSTCSQEEAAAQDPCFYTGRAILTGRDGTTLLDVEIAETPEQHATGLMDRPALEERAGMIFVFFEESTGGFWMKDTLIPLSIAFFDQDGTIVDILDMEPCTEEPCEVYTPKAPYWGALEVNQGAFETWGVTEGEDVNVVQGDRDALFN